MYLFESLITLKMGWLNPEIGKLMMEFSFTLRAGLSSDIFEIYYTEFSFLHFILKWSEASVNFLVYHLI